MNTETLQNMDDVTILNALFAIAAIEAKGDELTWQDEQDYQQLDWEMFRRMGEHGHNTSRN